MDERDLGRIPTATDGLAAVATTEPASLPVAPVGSSDRSMRMLELFLSAMAIAAALLVAAMR